MLHTLESIKKYKTSNILYILGSGPSVLDITDKQWQHIKSQNSMGFNHWYVHDFEPTFYDLSYLADNQFKSKETSMYYHASKKFKSSKFILNKGITQTNLEYFKDREFYQTYINHFDFFERDLKVIEQTNGNEIGKLATYWSKDFFQHFKHSYGELLPNRDYIYKGRGQLFASIQLGVLLGYSDIRLVGVDLLNESKFQDFIDTAPISATSPISKKGSLDIHKKHMNNALNPNSVHNTAQATKDRDYLGIHKLIRIFKEKCLSRVGVSITVANPASLLTTEGIEYKPIEEQLEINKITFCIPSKSNLRYLKTCIPSIRKNAFRKDHDIIVFVDSDEDGTVDWLEQVKDKYSIKYFINPNLGQSLFGIGKAYDFCIEKSTTDVFMIFHADMILGKDADLKAIYHLKEKTVVCSTRVEPPLHPNGGEKILLDFGMWPEEFNKDGFDTYVDSQLNETKYSEGIFAPWMMYKKEFMALGGHDPIMHSCREDSDVFNRMSLAGFKFIQPWNSLVYHFTGRGAGSFDGDKQRHEEWKRAMNNSTKEFIRKWGSNVKHTPLMKPLVSPKYDIGFILKNCTQNLLEALEPWADTTYTDYPYEDYIAGEEANTSHNLFDRLKPFDNQKHNEVLVQIDGNTFNQQDFQIIQQLSDILQDSGEVGKFTIGNLVVEVIQLNNYEHNLITLE